METLFYQVGLITIVATLFAFLARYTKQPLIPAYILTGFLLGPAFNLISNTSFIEALSELGIIFLLFLVGLELDLSKLKPIANVEIIGGFAQIFFTALIAYLISTKLGYATIPSVYFGLIIALSSTMVVVKMLSDKRQLDTAHGRIIIGILILQDIVAIAAILFLESTESITNSIPLLILHITLTFSIIILILHFIAPVLFDIAAYMSELLLLLSLSLCFFFVILFQWSGFSMSIGAFIAGMLLANLPYRLEITSKLRSLRDFFATLFFVSLGMQLSFETLQGLFWPVVIFVLLTLLLKPLILLGICNAFGYTKRSAFITAISLAQVSEFSLILAAEGLKLGHLNYNMLTIIVLVTMITITLSSYLFNFEYYIYKLMLPFLALMEKIHVTKPKFMLLPKREKWDIVLCGFHRIGHC